MGDANYLVLLAMVVVVSLIVGKDIADRTNASIAEHPEVNMTQVQADYCHNSPDICDWKQVIVVAVGMGVALAILLYAIPLIV